LRAIATEATASGGATMAPSAIAAAKGMSGISACSTKATAKAVISTMPIASWVIARSARRIAITDDSTAAAYSNGGSNTVSTTSGSTSTVGTAGMNDTAIPAMTSRIGDGTLIRAAIPLTTTTPTTNRTTCSSSGIATPSGDLC
jgi:hypothetical protein